MAKGKRSRTRRLRLSRAADVITDNWLLVLVSQTVATIILMVAAHYLGVPPVPARTP